MSTIYYVSTAGDDRNNGSKEQPFRSIRHAAALAQAGDTVVVSGGTYREWVDPQAGGASDKERITYIAARGEHPVIKGSEQVTGWEQVEGTVWKKVLDNSFFGEFNPYKELLWGDWVVDPEDTLHLGDVYLNGKSFYEATSLEEVKHPTERTQGKGPDWMSYTPAMRNPKDSLYVWYATVDADHTTIYANFQGSDPNKELVEINVRRYCFFPSKTGRNYITLSGFEIAQAATQWAPPTASQDGMVGANWSLGWIIENCDLHDAKCSAISIGTTEATGNNFFTTTKRKPGYNYQFEGVCRAVKMGWSKELVGSHRICHNVIHDCGQNGVVGNLGCIFSEISDNEIYNIATKYEFFGHEIAGIKLHAPIDVQIVHNYIHDCALGTWLDWEVQGTRISRNIYCKNDRDLMVEVTHGPHIVDNNILGSSYSLDNVADGGAYVHNLFGGAIRIQDVPDRSTPYHYPHSTDLLGSAFVYSFDDRIYRNIYLGGAPEYNPKKHHCGTADYDDCPTSYEDYIAAIEKVEGDEQRYATVNQPVYINENCYLNGAAACRNEKDNFSDAGDPAMQLLEEAEGLYLELTLPEGFVAYEGIVNSGDFLPNRAADEFYEDPDGNPIAFCMDLDGKLRDKDAVAGPLAALHAGKNRVKVWSR